VLALPKCRGVCARIAGPLYERPEFVEAWGQSVRDALAKFPLGARVHLLFSAHAIPAGRGGADGAAYAKEVAESARLIADQLDNARITSVAYQSRAPWGRWTGPRIEQELERLGKAGVRNCLIVPISFLYDNVETWCDIDMEIIPRAADFGMTRIMRATPPLESPHLLEALIKLSV
ncbi:MAG: ferrochelatase, partial [Pseudomonadota bacterium]